MPLLCLPALSVPFAVLYLIAGLTDMLDGAIARKTGTVSKVGAYCGRFCVYGCLPDEAVTHN